MGQPRSEYYFSSTEEEGEGEIGMEGAVGTQDPGYGGSSPIRDHTDSSNDDYYCPFVQLTFCVQYLYVFHFIFVCNYLNHINSCGL